MKRNSRSEAEDLSSTLFVDRKGGLREGEYWRRFDDWPCWEVVEKDLSWSDEHPILRGIIWCIAVSLLGAILSIILGVFVDQPFRPAEYGLSGAVLANTVGLLGGIAIKVYDWVLEKQRKTLISFLISSVVWFFVLINIIGALKDLRVI
jgi:hypothetical protein